MSGHRELVARVVALEALVGAARPAELAPVARPRIADILAAVAAETGIAREEIVGRRHSAPIARARQVVMHGDRVIRGRVVSDPDLARLVAAIRFALSIRNPQEAPGA